MELRSFWTLVDQGTATMVRGASFAVATSAGVQHPFQHETDPELEAQLAIPTFCNACGSRSPCAALQRARDLNVATESRLRYFWAVPDLVGRLTEAKLMTQSPLKFYLILSKPYDVRELQGQEAAHCILTAMFLHTPRASFFFGCQSQSQRQMLDVRLWSNGVWEWLVGRSHPGTSKAWGLRLFRLFNMIWRCPELQAKVSVSHAGEASRTRHEECQVYSASSETTAYRSLRAWSWQKEFANEGPHGGKHLQAKGQLNSFRYFLFTPQAPTDPIANLGFK